MRDYKYNRIIIEEGEQSIAKVVYVPDEVVKQIRADVIEEFVKKICEKYTEEESKDNYKQYCGEIKQNIADIAEQLKAKEQK